jgi:XTP/dITP diphosphohydrolase
VDLLIATSNPNKLREIRQVLADGLVTLHGLDELTRIEEPEETGATFAENARLKADYYDRHLRRASVPWGADALTVAEDSGLVIDALNGEPGVRSARFIRPDATYEERFAEIERRLAERPERPRTARFVCALAAVRDGGVIFETEGVVEGTIASTPAGHRGFGYDPIFYVPSYGRTLAEVDDAEKLAVAHRGQAFRALAAWIRHQPGAERRVRT